MEAVYYSATIDSEPKFVWSIMLESILNPDKYLAGVNSFNILEKNEHFVLRKISTEYSYKERVEINEQKLEIKYILIEHPKFRGLTYYQLTIKDNGKCVLSAKNEWQSKKSISEFNQKEDLLYKLLKNSVVNIKEICENRINN